MSRRLMHGVGEVQVGGSDGGRMGGTDYWSRRELTHSDAVSVLRVGDRTEVVSGSVNTLSIVIRLSTS